MAIENIQEELKRHAEAGRPVGMLSLDAENEILSFVPDDMTVKVAAGIRFVDLQTHLAEFRQWLPLDPWDESCTIKQIIDDNLYGPRRYGYGSVREHLIGMEMLLADGRLIQSGGNVVKNVAGYDVLKLFVGARQSLGIVTSATFKLLPLPGRETILTKRCASPSEAAELTRRLLDSEVCPTILDWHRLQSGDSVDVCTAFAGTDDQVEWQLKELASFGLKQIDSTDYERAYFGKRKEAPKMSSVLPSRLGETVEQLGSGTFVARAGNGVIWADERLGTPAPRSAELERRLKNTFDPAGIMPALEPTC